MNPNSPKPNYLKPKTHSTQKPNTNTGSKKKLITDQKVKISHPQTPRNFQKSVEEEEKVAHYIKTVSLTNNLIKAVENQKQILKNIKTISAEILKNRKAKRKISKGLQNSEENKKFYFPIKTSQNDKIQIPRTLYGIDESISSENSEGNGNFDQYCLLNTTRPKIMKTQQIESDHYLKPKILSSEKRKKTKRSKNRKANKKRQNESLKGSREKSYQVKKSLSKKKYNEKPVSPKYIEIPSEIRKQRVLKK